jgi:hypothetical protein
MEEARRSQLLYDYASNRHEFTLFDFGSGSTEVPMINAQGEYLVKTAVFPVLRGTERPTYDGPLPGKEGDVTAMGNDWFVTVVEINHFATFEGLNKKLRDAEELLLNYRAAHSAGVPDSAKSANG